MVSTTAPSVETIPCTSPFEDIVRILKRDGVIVLSGFVSCHRHDDPHTG